MFQRFQETSRHMKTDNMSTFARWSQWLLHEPFVHFLALGGLIFGAYAVVAPTTPSAAKRIEVSENDLARLQQISMQQWGREPDAQTMRDLVDSFVREEVLYREALANGLDRDDVIVRRRLAQKMEFLANEDVRAPTDEDLRKYFSENTQRFAQPALLDVDQVVFRSVRRGPDSDATLQDAMRRLRAGRPVRGDGVTLPTRVVRQDREQLERDYGGEFAQVLFALPDNTWSGPIRSAMGLHLVRVRHHASRASTFEEVRGRVLAELTQRRVEQARADAYARLRSRYTVISPLTEQATEMRVSQL